MIILSTLGYLRVEAEQDAQTLRVSTYDVDSLEAVTSGVELFLEASEPLEAQDGVLLVPKDAFAAWISHEVMNYLDYPNFSQAMASSRGMIWGQVVDSTDENVKENV